MLCMLVCSGAEVGSWYGIADMGYMAGGVAVHMVQSEVVDLVGRRALVEVVGVGVRMAWIEAEEHMTSHFAGRKPVMRDERGRRRMVARWGRRYYAALETHSARCSVDHLLGRENFDFAADHSCPVVAYDGTHGGAHDVRQGSQGRMGYSGYRHFDLTSCCVHIMEVKWWNVKLSGRTERTLKSSDHIARPPCGPKSWYLHHLEHTLEPAAAAAAAFARPNQLDVNYAVFERGARIDLSSAFLAVYR